MLEIDIPAGEYWDNVNNVFITTKPYKLRLEHSLISLTRWEQRYKKSYFRTFSNKQVPPTLEETLYYFYCMSIDKNVPEYVFQRLTQQQIVEIMNYMNDEKTATKITPRPRKRGGPIRKPPVMTSEVIYSYMAEYNLPFDICSKWHLSNLLTLINVCSEENAPAEKIPQKQVMKDYAAINKANREKYHTKG